MAAPSEQMAQVTYNTVCSLYYKYELNEFTQLLAEVFIFLLSSITTLAKLLLKSLQYPLKILQDPLKRLQDPLEKV
jgi:hypothetical protein